jgi:hypothetical protein
METLIINKLVPNYVVSLEPDSLNKATYTARAMWKRKIMKQAEPYYEPNYSGNYNKLPDDIREEFILNIKSNQHFCNNQ